MSKKPIPNRHSAEDVYSVPELLDEIARLRNLLEERPALNAGLIEAYTAWTWRVYASDLHIPPEKFDA
ncbi:MAG: hypothetical protein WDN30_14300 [Pararobbsia sp.]